MAALASHQASQAEGAHAWPHQPPPPRSCGLGGGSMEQQDRWGTADPTGGRRATRVGHASWRDESSAGDLEEVRSRAPACGGRGAEFQEAGFYESLEYLDAKPSHRTSGSIHRGEEKQVSQPHILWLWAGFVHEGEHSICWSRRPSALPALRSCSV